jgi:hypothetical protein
MRVLVQAGTAPSELVEAASSLESLAARFAVV